MKLNLGYVDEIGLELSITDYKDVFSDWSSHWCNTKFAIKGKYINYETDGEILRSYEIKKIRDALRTLFFENQKEGFSLAFVEPDLTLKIEILDINDFYGELKVKFWFDGMLSGDYYVMHLRQEDLKHLYYYLQLITGEIQNDAPEITKMVENKVILKDR